MGNYLHRTQNIYVEIILGCMYIIFQMGIFRKAGVKSRIAKLRAMVEAAGAANAAFASENINVERYYQLTTKKLKQQSYFSLRTTEESRQAPINIS